MRLYRPFNTKKNPLLGQRIDNERQVRRSRFYLGLALLIFLSACRQTPEVIGDPNAELRYTICKEALEQPLEHRAYQGFGGWFFFTLDLKETYPLYRQTAFLTEFSRKLRAEGTSLIMIPVTGRALVRPDMLYLGDPVQINFDPDQAEKAYGTFLSTLGASGVQIFDTLEAARAYDASGGQTFFRRDLHWRSEGAKAIFEGVAEQIEQFAPELPNLNATLERTSNDRHHGKFIEKWTTRNCGYRLPGEAQGVYTVTPTVTGSPSSDVILVGSSFSIPPYNYDFLAAALQSEVLNMAVGAGGARVSLERYLASETYQARKPRVLVWEFPLYASEFTPSEQTRLLSLVR